LRRIRLPPPITPIGDHSFNEEEQVTENDILDIRDDNVIERLPSNSVEGYSKKDYSEYESIVNDKDAHGLNSNSKENKAPKTITSILYNCRKSIQYLIAV
jgi:hypothetical protein